MVVVFDVVLSTGSLLSAGGVLTTDLPLVEGQQVQHYGQKWFVEAIDDHQSPSVLTLRRIELSSG